MNNLRSGLGPKANYYDSAMPLPQEVPVNELIQVHDLSKVIAPEGSRRFVRTNVHEVRRSNGSTGFQVINEFPDGVSLLPIDIVNGKAYAIMTDQVRYPHAPDGNKTQSLAELAEQGRIGRWGREIVSGGVDPEDSVFDENGAYDREASFINAVKREASEEAGVIGLADYQVERIFPQIFSSVGVNNQSFNLYVAQLEDGQWAPELTHPDIEEGNMHLGAYRLDTAVPEMIDKGIIWEMSAIAALSGLWTIAKYRKYL